jgi:hypothetical protein
MNKIERREPALESKTALALEGKRTRSALATDGPRTERNMETTMTEQPPTLEQRIVAAVEPDADVTSADVAALIEAAEAGITKAEEECTVDHTLALDPRAAREAIKDATFAANRLRMLLSKLQVRHRLLCEQARVSEYEAAARVLDEESVQLAHELRETYPAAINRVIDLFARIAAHRQRMSALHGTRPPRCRKRARS